MANYSGPLVSPGFKRQIHDQILVPLTHVESGEFTASANGIPLGAPRVAGKVSDVWLSVGASGKDDSNTLSLTADVQINGTTCLTTQPIIAHVSGEASTNKTTKESGDTGVTQAVVSQSANSVSAGDMLTCNLTLTRTASPTTEMANAAIVVEFTR